MKLAPTPLLMAAALAIGSVSSPARADHEDSPAARADPAADIADLFAWMTPDAGRLILAMDVVATDRFSATTQYVFHVHSMQVYGGRETLTLVICTFDAAQTIRCWVKDEAGGGVRDFVSGDASAPDGVWSISRGTRVFTGIRNDPFFFNHHGFERALAAVGRGLGGVARNGAGCPAIDAGTVAVARTELSTNDGMQPAVDAYAGQDVLSIIVELDRALVTSGGSIVGVWASTRRP